MSKRATGYYWVIFNWAKHGFPEKEHWEPASWDAQSNSWVTLGSRQMVSSVLENHVFLKIGDRIVEPPP